MKNLIRAIKGVLNFIVGIAAIFLFVALVIAVFVGTAWVMFYIYNSLFPQRDCEILLAHLFNIFSQSCL